MEFAQFKSVAQKIYENGSMDIRLAEDTAFSLPVVVRRSNALYDAVFLYRKPLQVGSGASSPRPYAWALLEAVSGDVALLTRCDLVDFVPQGRYDPDCMLELSLNKELSAKKAAALHHRLLLAYENLRTFAFEENLTRGQASTVTEYKELFGRLSYSAHYSFYYALSPAFFHWLRLPLPKEFAGNTGKERPGLQEDGYQLLILENLQQLARQFQEKISVDSHKEHLFDELHRELQSYKNDLLGTLTQAMELDIIQVIDSVCKSVEAYREKERTEENFTRLLELLAGVETDLCDLLYRHGVEPYQVEEVDVARQKILSTVKTSNPELDKSIAASLTRGWEKDGKIIRPQRVSVYLYDADSAAANEEDKQVHE